MIKAVKEMAEVLCAVLLTMVTIECIGVALLAPAALLKLCIMALLW